MSLPHVPIVRWGRDYDSLDRLEVVDHRTGRPVAQVGQANPGMIRRDVKKAGVLRRYKMDQLLDICTRAGQLFLHETLPLSAGTTQSAQQYIEMLSATSGLPHSLVRSNMSKIHEVFVQMPTILCGLTRGLDAAVIDGGIGEQSGSPVSFYPDTKCLGVVMPSNSPGVNSIWMPAIPLKVPVLIKPGREDPWTPMRIIRAFLAAGCPDEAFGFYPTDHEGADTILRTCDRGIIFGDVASTSRYGEDQHVQIHGPGFSKIILGEDVVDQWSKYLDLIVESICANGGRSCINASVIVVPRQGLEIANAVARRLEDIQPRTIDDNEAILSAFSNPSIAEAINATISQALGEPGATECTTGPRLVPHDGALYLRPTIVHCDSISHPLANREFLFPFATVVEMPQDEMLSLIGPSLVVTAITDTPEFIADLLACPQIDRLNIGAVPTSRVSWNQPHEGNIFELLYRRRAIQKAGM